MKCNFCTYQSVEKLWEHIKQKEPFNLIYTFGVGSLYLTHSESYFFNQITTIFIIINVVNNIIVSVMCMSGHFCNTRLFSNCSYSVLCSKNVEVMKLAETRYDETNLDIYPFLIINMEKPNFGMALFCVIITIICTNYPNVIIIVCTNYYYVSNSVCKL